jgi:hypothetical protein
MILPQLLKMSSEVDAKPNLRSHDVKSASIINSFLAAADFSIAASRLLSDPPNSKNLAFQIGAIASSTFGSV